MQAYLKLSFCCLVFISLSAAAQTTVTTAGGVTNQVPLFTGNATLSNSVITQSNGNVGIGTTAPQHALDVYGNSYVSGTVTAGLLQVSGTNNTQMVQLFDSATGSTIWNIGIGNATGDDFSIGDGSTNSNRFVIQKSTGNIGLGTAVPAYVLDVNGATRTGNISFGNLAHPPYITPLWNDNNNTGLAFHTFGNAADITALSIQPGTGNVSIANALTLAASLNHPPYVVGTWNDNNNTGLAFHAFGNSVDITALSIQPGTGNVGIGTSIPGTKLEVNGNVKLTLGSGASITFADGTVQSTAYTGVTCGGDYAESVDVSGDRRHYVPGDVLVIDPDNPGKFLKSAEPYSASVMGIYSTKPGYVGRRQTTPQSPDEVPMAMIGIVPTKVSAENGAIRPGDLLVTSSTPGYAMKGTDHSKMLGAVVGKALASLESGTGVIEVGVTLQ